MTPDHIASFGANPIIFRHFNSKLGRFISSSQTIPILESCGDVGLFFVESFAVCEICGVDGALAMTCPGIGESCGVV